MRKYSGHYQLRNKPPQRVQLNDLSLWHALSTIREQLGPDADCILIVLEDQGEVEM